MVHSVSEKDMHTSFAIEQFNSLRHLSSPNERKGLFNCGFKVWKKKDLMGSAQIYKIGQMANVLVSYIDDSRRFFIQEEKRLADLNHLESCINKYADVLLADFTVRDELYIFQNKSSKFDVVLVRSSSDKKWHRAIYLDRMSSRDFNSIVDQEDLDGYTCEIEKSYHSFFLIDYGREEMIITRNNDPHRELFILPINIKLVQIGCFALKCSINEAYIKKRGLCVSESEIELRQQNECLFEKCFKEMLTHKRLQVRISQIFTNKAESEAIVELFYHENDAELVVNDLNDMTLLFDESLIDMNAKNNQFYLKLNCIHYVIKKMSLINQMVCNILSCYFLFELSEREKGSANFISFFFC